MLKCTLSAIKNTTYDFYTIFWLKIFLAYPSVVLRQVYQMNSSTVCITNPYFFLTFCWKAGGIPEVDLTTGGLICVILQEPL